VSDLLTFARQRPLRRADTDLNAVVREALEACPACHEDGVRWDLALAPDLPPVNADPEQIRQVVINLVTNATQAMREAPRRVGAVRTYGNEEVVGCEVADSGPGIPPEVLQRIFEPFFTTKGVGEGTGLGLSISHGIVRAHGGDIQVQNRAEGGARFWFELPRRTSRGTRVTDG
jgi:signal transduction histidine kinase